VQHCTPEQLALAALREPLPDADAAHLAACDACRADVASLQRSVDALAVPQLAAPGAPVTPPPAVWEAIAAATGVTATPRPEVVAASTEAPAAPALAVAPPVVEPPAVESPAPGDGSVLPFRSRRRFLLLAAGATVAATVAGAAIGAGVSAVLRDAETPDVVPVAAVDLDPLADNDASGRAEVVERTDGTRVLEVQLRAGELVDRYYEVWLIDEAVEDMVPVGVARSGTVTFELPDGLDLGRFPIVDVSVEPLDGNPTHSGVSVARGVLDT
jgi:Anti-sigma-K factor rskA